MAGCVPNVDLGGACWLSLGNISRQLIGYVIGTVVKLIFNKLKLIVNKYQSGCTYMMSKMAHPWATFISFRKNVVLLHSRASRVGTSL